MKSQLCHKNQFAEENFSEKHFIKEKQICTKSFWLNLFLFALMLLLTVSVYNWQQKKLQENIANDSFLKVTNRDLSLFLWQFPSFMRLHNKSKVAYLEGFHPNFAGMRPHAPESYATVPPDLLWLYHNWKQLLAPIFIPRKINAIEFEKFLQALPEWLPEAWPNAPVEYKVLVNTQAFQKTSDLQNLSYIDLPLAVRQAFVGWKNFKLEGNAINQYHPSPSQINVFLQKFPQYQRHLWRNIEQIDGHQIAEHTYLSNAALLEKSIKLPVFLKVALYNDYQSALEGF